MIIVETNGTDPSGTGGAGGTLTDVATLDAIAGCLGYPNSNSASEARRAADGWNDSYPQVAAQFTELAEWLEATDQLRIEEVYTNLFDLKPACTLDIGHHVYGEAYQRGALLAGFVREHKAHDVDPGDELPDFLPTVLKLLGRLDDTPEREMLIVNIIGVAVGRMKKALIQIDTPWAHAVSSLADVFIAPAEDLDDTLHKRIRLEVLNGA